MFNIPGHKGNANKNHVKISFYSCYGYHQEYQQQQVLVRMWGKRNSSHISGGNVN
jgi:hypothetical protein